MKEKESFDAWANAWRVRFEEAAERALPLKSGPLAGLQEAMRYAVLDGGKRVRALLAYAAGEVTGADPSHTDKAALAVEFVHAYSLVHDDLRCMDNDLLRRGKPTCHVKYGVAQAMLAGDALQPEAFKQLVSPELGAQTSVALVAELTLASGADGMCGGQMIDLQHVGQTMDIDLLRMMHAMKTGALIRSAVRMGAMCGDPRVFASLDADLTVYADRMGLAFQMSTTSWTSPPIRPRWARRRVKTKPPASRLTCRSSAWIKPGSWPSVALTKRLRRSSASKRAECALAAPPVPWLGWLIT